MALAALALSPGAANAQEKMRPGSAIAGVTWPVSAWDWPDVEGGRRQTIVEAAAGVAGGTCGPEREFNAWNMAEEEHPEAFRDNVLSSYTDAGWVLTQPDATTPELHVATRGDTTLVVWTRLNAEKQALSLFTCAVGATPVAISAPAVDAEPGADRRATAVKVTVVSDVTNVLRDFGIGALAVALGMFLYGLVQRRRATAALTWLTVPATIESSRVETRTQNDADGDESIWHTPKLLYTYSHAGIDYRGERVRFGSLKTAALKKAEAVVARYPVGATVEARVNPRKPAESTLEIEKIRLRVFLPLSIVFALVGAGLLVASQVMPG